MVGRVKVWLQKGGRSCDKGGNEAVSRAPGLGAGAGAGVVAESVEGDHDHIPSPGLGPGLGPQGDGLTQTTKEDNDKGLNDGNEQINNNSGVLNSTKLLIPSSSAISSSPSSSSSSTAILSGSGGGLPPNNSVNGSSSNPVSGPIPVANGGSDSTSGRIGEENVRLATGDVMDVAAAAAAGGGAVIGAGAGAGISPSIPSAGPLEVVYEAPDERESSGHDRESSGHDRESSHSSMRGDRSSLADSDAGASRRSSMKTPMDSPGII